MRPAVATAHARLARAALAALACLAQAAPARAARTVDISGLQDVAFTALDPTLSATRSQNICVFSSAPGRYNVTARGSGSASAFTLSSGGPVSPLPYQVQWSDMSGATTGTALSPGVALTGQTSLVIDQTCSHGPTSSASLIVALSASDLQGAASGLTYTGTLSLTIAPE